MGIAREEGGGTVTKDRNRNKKLWLALLMGLLVIFAVSNVLAAGFLQMGSKGSLVKEVQGYLYSLRYLRESPTGYFGGMTREAVKSFQIEHGLKGDGNVGPETLAALKDAIRERSNTVSYTVSANESLADIAQKYNTTAAAIMLKNNLASNEIVEGQRLVIPVGDNRGVTVASRGRSGVIQAIPWSIVNQLWKDRAVVRVFDLASGRSFLGRRYGGYYHADVEPLTKEDTRIMLAIYGGHWSWDRRAVVVLLDNQYVAASMNGMPHGGESIFNNDFKGQFCIHFLGSRIHKNGRVDPIHQAMIEKAATATVLPWESRSDSGNVSSREAPEVPEDPGAPSNSNDPDTEE